jgi:glucose-1-phosphate cytidylyltransferase
MKAVILAGGLGTRISEETNLKPKPMIEIGGMPILWHIMKIYASHNVKDFIICCGYKGYIIKEYFVNYFLHTSDITIDISKNKIKLHQRRSDSWLITLVDTGVETMTGGRLKRIFKYIKDEKEFCFTYGDGLSDINITELINFHRSHGKLATLTAVQPPGRFGSLIIDNSKVKSVVEKPQGDGAWINGGFFVLSPKVLDYIDGDDTVWERFPMENLAITNQLEAYLHKGFWQPMDTIRDKDNLEQLWLSKKAPWMIW